MGERWKENSSYDISPIFKVKCSTENEYITHSVLYSVHTYTCTHRAIGKVLRS